MPDDANIMISVRPVTMRQAHALCCSFDVQNGRNHKHILYQHHIENLTIAIVGGIIHTARSTCQNKRELGIEHQMSDTKVCTSSQKISNRSEHKSCSKSDSLQLCFFSDYRRGIEFPDPCDNITLTNKPDMMVNS